MEITSVNELIVRANTAVLRARNDLNERQKLEADLAVTKETLLQLQAKQDLFLRSSNLIGLVTDEITQTALNSITNVVNQALRVLFPEGNRQIMITKTMYRKKYPHFNVDLIVDGGKKRSFKQSGSGLKQIISFLFVLSFIDARGGRKILVMDEILPGVHSAGKRIIRDLMNAVSDRFQFVMIAYDFDIGNEFEVVRTGDTAIVRPYGDGTPTYYADNVMGADVQNESL